MQGWKSEGTWKQRKKEDNGMNGGGDGKGGVDISPTQTLEAPGDQKVSPARPFERPLVCTWLALGRQPPRPRNKA